MNVRFTLALLLVAVLAIGGSVIAQKQLPTNSPTPTTTPVLIKVAAADVTDLQVSTQGKETHLSRSNDKWRLVKPVADENVDQGRVDSLVGQLSQLSGSRTVTTTLDNLGQFGLAQPSLSAAIITKDNRTSGLLVGGKTVDGNAYYAMPVGGSEVDLIPNAIVNGLTDLAINPPQATPTPLPTATPTATPSPTPTPAP